MVRPKYPSDKQDQFMLRLPNGLRDRIKAKADEHKRSMNAEIVHVLEQKYPEPWDLQTRLIGLLGLMEIMKKGLVDKAVDEVTDDIYQTLHAVANGRIKGVAADVRDQIRDLLQKWDIDWAEELVTRDMEGMDPDEIDGIASGRQKYPEE